MRADSCVGGIICAGLLLLSNEELNGADTALALSILCVYQGGLCQLS